MKILLLDRAGGTRDEDALQFELDVDDTVAHTLCMREMRLTGVYHDYHGYHMSSPMPCRALVCPVLGGPSVWCFTVCAKL